MTFCVIIRPVCTIFPASDVQEPSPVLALSMSSKTSYILAGGSNDSISRINIDSCSDETLHLHEPQLSLRQSMVAKIKSPGTVKVIYLCLVRICHKTSGTINQLLNVARYMLLMQELARYQHGVTVELL